MSVKAHFTDRLPSMNLCHRVNLGSIALMACCLSSASVAAQDDLAAIRADLSSGQRDRITSAIAKVEQQRLAAAYADVYKAFSASKDSHVRRQALFLMSRSGAPQVLRMVREAIDDPKAADIGIRHLSAYELSLQRITKIDDKALVLPAIQKAIHDPDIYYRKYGAAALASYAVETDDLISQQTDLASDPSDVVRFTLLGNLAKGNRSTIAATRMLLPALKSDHAGDRIAAAYSLARFQEFAEQHPLQSEQTLRFLMKELSQTDVQRAGSAGYALAYLIRWPKFLSTLQARLNDGTPVEIAYAATVLQETKHDFDVNVLQRVFDSNDPIVRLRAVALLARHPSLEAIRILNSAIADESPDVRKAAVFALQACGWIAEFTEVGKKPNGRGVSTLVVKENRNAEENGRFAVASLALLEAGSSSDPVVGTFAREALVRIGANPPPKDLLIDYAHWQSNAGNRKQHHLNDVAGTQLTDGDVLDIGTQKQLFIDDFVVGDIQNAQRVAHPFQKHPANPIMRAAAPWEENWLDNFMCSVHYDPQSRDFKMWYRCGANHTLAGYAVSADGIQWQRPNLGVVEYDGSRDNNLLGWKGELFRDAHQPGHNIVLQPDAPPEQRYLSFFDYSGEKRGFYVSYSADGIRWSEPRHAQMVYGDVATVIPDPEGGFLFFPKQMRWVDGYRRSFGFAHIKTIDAYAPKTYPFTALTGKHDELVGRRAARGFGVLARGTLNPTDGGYYSNWHTQIYSVTPLVYEGHVLGFYDLWYLTGRREGPLDLMLMATRDRKAWDEVGYPNPVLPTGQMGQWDAGMVYGGSNILVVDDEIRLYYSGFNKGHYTDIPWGSQTHHNIGVGLATMRLDGFVSLHAIQSATVTTKPLKFSGQRLQINANAKNGEIKIAIVDENGKPMQGFSSEECDVCSQDDLRHTVSWQGNSDVSTLKGKVIRLKISIKNADLYAFQFRP